MLLTLPSSCKVDLKLMSSTDSVPPLVAHSSDSVCESPTSSLVDWKINSLSMENLNYYAYNYSKDNEVCSYRGYF